MQENKIKMTVDLFVGIKWSSEGYQHQVRIKFLPSSQGWVKYSIYRGYSGTSVESCCLSNCLADHFWMIIIAHCCSLLKTIDIHPKNYSLQFREYLCGIYSLWRKPWGNASKGGLFYQFLFLQVGVSLRFTSKGHFVILCDANVRIWFGIWVKFKEKSFFLVKWWGGDPRWSH